MLDLKFIRENPERVRANLDARGSSVDLDRLLALDAQRRSLLQELEDVRRQRNEHSAAIKGRTPSDEERERGRVLKESEPRLEAELRAAEAELDALNRTVPNMVQPDVPPGRDESANQLVRRWGEPPKFGFEPLDHLALAEKHDLVDFEGGAKVTGPKFYFLKNEAVLLEHALVRYALEILRCRGFTLMQTPDLARRDVCAGTGFNPDGPERQVYTIEDSDLALIGTAEITLSGLHASDLLEHERLPIRYCGVSHCFRLEAGAAGRSGRGLYRVHQFTKVEMFAYTHPDASDDMHREFLAIEEQVFQGLELPYRVMLLCAGDAAAQSARTYDIEAWMPGREAGGSYGEITSTSTCTDYQARRLGIRFRDPDGGGKPRFVHMLNGTAVATARLLIPMLEIHQQADGSVRIPKALQPYTGFDRIG